MTHPTAPLAEVLETVSNQCKVRMHRNCRLCIIFCHCRYPKDEPASWSEQRRCVAEKVIDKLREAVWARRWHIVRQAALGGADSRMRHTPIRHDVWFITLLRHVAATEALGTGANAVWSC